MKRVICCGGRAFKDRVHIFKTLDSLRGTFGMFVMIEGGAHGADRICREWAMSKGSPVATVFANWDRYGTAAGRIRNGWMLELQPDFVVAFDGGTGTANMKKQARDAGITVYEV